VVAALLLYREALPLLVAAVALAHDPQFVPTGFALPVGTTPWQVLDELQQRGRLNAKGLPAKLEKARAALDAPEALSFDRLPPQLALDRRAAVQTAVRSLRRLIEPGTPSELRGRRYARVAVTVVLVALLGCGLVSSLRHPNLALKKPATASSRHPTSTAPADNSGIDNGQIESTYGIETAPGPGWVMIDLQEEQKISRVKIFNRRDALFDAGLPLMLEISTDAVTFTLVDTRTQPFSSSNPWVFKAPSGMRARFIRVRSNSLVALTEIEVY